MQNVFHVLVFNGSVAVRQQRCQTVQLLNFNRLEASQCFLIYNKPCKGITANSCLYLFTVNFICNLTWTCAVRIAILLATTMDCRLLNLQKMTKYYQQLFVVSSSVIFKDDGRRHNGQKLFFNCCYSFRLKKDGHIFKNSTCCRKYFSSDVSLVEF